MTRRRSHRLTGLAAVVSAALLVLAGCSSTDPSAPEAAAVSPTPAASPDEHEHDHHDGAHAHAVTGDGREDSAAGYRLTDLQHAEGQVTFKVTKEAGGVETRFTSTHTKKLHMFVFATDLSEFRHVHPTMSQRGVWTLDLPGLAQETHRVVVEFTPESTDVGAVMLGGSIDTGGDRAPRPLPTSVGTVQVDGYAVALGGAAQGDGAVRLEVVITGADGRPTKLLPYLGSWAHAALVHAETLALTHLHPGQEHSSGAPSPDRLTFDAALPAVGDHRLIVEFRTSTGVHQAEFTLTFNP